MQIAKLFFRFFLEIFSPVLNNYRFYCNSVLDCCKIDRKNLNILDDDFACCCYIEYLNIQNYDLDPMTIG